MTVRRFRQATAYVQACYWIAVNDEGREYDSEIVERQLTVLLVAEIFGKTPRDVAEEVVVRRIASTQRHLTNSEAQTMRAALRAGASLVSWGKP